MIEQFTSGAVDKVELVYTRFVSAGNQEVVLRPLVPLSVETVAGGDGKAGPADAPAGDYEYEPDPARSSMRCCPATSRPVSTPPCSTPRHPSTPSVSGR